MFRLAVPIEIRISHDGFHLPILGSDAFDINQADCITAHRPSNINGDGKTSIGRRKFDNIISGRIAIQCLRLRDAMEQQNCGVSLNKPT
jgi:hypothetical protein